MSIQLTPCSSARWIAAIDCVVVLRSPAELPAPAADRPGAEADAGDLEARLANLVVFSAVWCMVAPFGE